VEVNSRALMAANELGGGRRAGLAAGDDVGDGAHPGVAHDPHPHLERGQPVDDQRIGRGPALPRQRDQVVEDPAVERGLVHRARGPLVSQAGAHQLPALVLRADPVGHRRTEPASSASSGDEDGRADEVNCSSTGFGDGVQA
jgi:hypothetical protein